MAIRPIGTLSSVAHTLMVFSLVWHTFGLHEVVTSSSGTYLLCCQCDLCGIPHLGINALWLPSRVNKGKVWQRPEMEGSNFKVFVAPSSSL